MDRSILHCDMNNFYASVERLFDPALQGVPVAVCGDEEMRHGIVLAKSEEAKRCGVKTGDAIWEAKQKCPEIRIVPPRFDRYVTYSRYAREIYLEYTDLVESFGLDECWLDVTASRLAFGDGVKIATEIRNRTRSELGLTISVGISFNKIFAKLGSD
ncbi:MAG: DNA polymerase IV, partial [Clostridia bacterium]|nr:DNA polymerase IV [Clostridia bacterium]